MSPDFAWLKGRRIAITGGAGFIGTNLTAKLLEYGAEVVCLDNFSTGFRENTVPFEKNPSYTLIEGDIRDKNACTEAFAGADFVLHQAALGSVPRSIADPVESTSVNVTGFAAVLHAAVQCGVKKVVYASSSSVYGDSECMPKKEDGTGLPLSPYAATKGSCELLAAGFAASYGMDVIGLRYFNVFGPWQNPNGAYSAVIPRFIAALLAGKAPTIYGDGEKIRRDFTFVDNVVNANILAMASGKNPRGCVCNIACGGSISLLELFLAVRSELAAEEPGLMDIEPEYGAVRNGDIPVSCADISLAETLLGYTPAVSFAEGIKRTCRWYRRQGSI